MPAGSRAAAAAAATGQPGPRSEAGYTFVRSQGGIDEYRLDSNGLSVILAADHSAPVVTFQVTYRVGSRNEVTGTTGSTHLLEHLMFKGSDAFNDQQGNSIKQYLERVGGMFNASTSEDWILGSTDPVRGNHRVDSCCGIVLGERKGRG